MISFWLKPTNEFGTSGVVVDGTPSAELVAGMRHGEIAPNGVQRARRSGERALR